VKKGGMGTDENQKMKNTEPNQYRGLNTSNQFDKSPDVSILYTILEQKQTK
jgi:hypothetical protein